MKTYTEKFFVEIVRDRNTNDLIKETWLDEKGNPHRPDLPAIIEYHPGTNFRVREEYWFHNWQSRDDGPVTIVRDPHTGVVTEEIWMKHGRPNRDLAPAIIRRDATTGEVILAQNYYEGLRLPDDLWDEPEYWHFDDDLEEPSC